MSDTDNPVQATTAERPPAHINTQERAEKLELLLNLGRRQHEAARGWLRLGFGADEAYRRARMGVSPDGR